MMRCRFGKFTWCYREFQIEKLLSWHLTSQRCPRRTWGSPHNNLREVYGGKRVHMRISSPHSCSVSSVWFYVMLGCVYNAPNLLCFLRLNKVITSTECLHQIRWQSESFWELPLCQSSSYSLGILRFEPVKQGVLVEGSGSGAVAAVTLDVGYCVRVLHNLDEPHFVPGRQAAVRDHPVFAKSKNEQR